MRDQIQFRPGHLLKTLEDRTVNGLSADLVAKRDLSRYYQLLKESLRRLELSESEAHWLCVIVGRIDASGRELRMEVSELVSLGKVPEGIDGEQLSRYLDTLSDSELLAIVDAAERYWRGAKIVSVRDVGLCGT